MKRICFKKGDKTMMYSVGENGTILLNGRPITCRHCGAILTKDDLREDLPENYTDDDFDFYMDDHGNYYCAGDYCGQDLVICEECGEIYHVDDSVYLERYYYHVCNNCCDNHYSTCELCDEIVHNDDLHWRDVYGHGEILVCDCCLEEMYVCDNCDCYIPDGEQYHHDGDTLCRDCFDERCEDEDDDEDGVDGIHSYHYTNDPTYHMPYLGIESRDAYPMTGWELEIESRTGEYGYVKNEHSDVIRSKIGSDYVVSCSDGSLCDGFELISCPATLEHHLKTLHIKDGLQEALKLGYRSHDGGHCGLHVHIDRQYFGNISKDDVEGRFFIVLRNNLEWIKQFSRRDYWGYCKINGYERNSDGSMDSLGKITYPPDKIWLNSKKQSERHMAINFYPRDTIEIRIFRGTLKYTTFIASLQMVNMWAYIVKRYSNADITQVNLYHFIEIARNRGYKEFLDYLKERSIINSDDTGF